MHFIVLLNVNHAHDIADLSDTDGTKKAEELSKRHKWHHAEHYDWYLQDKAQEHIKSKPDDTQGLVPETRGCAHHPQIARQRRQRCEREVGQPIQHTPPCKVSSGG